MILQGILDREEWQPTIEAWRQENLLNSHGDYLLQLRQGRDIALDNEFGGTGIMLMLSQ